MAVSTRNSLVSDTANKIREMILTGKLRPGEYLPPQKQLGAQFDVGLSTMHEALQVLASAGLVKSRPGKGTWVSTDALDTLVHPDAVRNRLGDMSFQTLVEARSVIEVTLVELAAERATDEELQRIWAAYYAMEGQCDVPTFAQRDLDFHMAVARAGHNELLEQFYHLAFKLLSELIAGLLTLPNVDRAGFCVNDRRMAEALQAHDRERAREVALLIMDEVKSLIGPLKQEGARARA
jgi:GntR family transcriptional regulator, transcriptional repressor for pyruvate dehydrogenase complex